VDGTPPYARSLVDPWASVAFNLGGVSPFERWLVARYDPTLTWTRYEPVSAENFVRGLPGSERLRMLFHARARIPNRAEFGKGW
jgi:hypothetical protein